MGETYTVKALSPMRKIIAARMVEAKQTIPHFRLTAELQVDALLNVRKTLRERNPEAGLSVNDLMIKACAAALIDAPAINVQWSDGEIRQFHSADVSVVIALENGLATPIVRNADVKSVCEISCEMREFASRAARNELRVHEILGGSFSISNLGMYGIDQFDAIINPPQCAILAIGSAKPRVVATAERQIEIATVMRATLSVDHRVVDGAIGAAFLSALRNRVERPDYLLKI
jgi:pyruvate dehydrogenase E2 component (dihydrolipoamide acetyltransferase)